jgi:hypothetical protein
VSPRFVLVSRWRLEATPERVWNLQSRPEDYPGWWPHLTRAERLGVADGSAVGARYRFQWRSGLGYGLHIVMTTTRSERLRAIEGDAAGDLRGIGLWLTEDKGPDAVCLSYRWDMELAKPWMRLAATLLRPIFAWRHFKVMAAGARGMAQRLGCGLADLREWSGITPLTASPG